MAPKVAKASTVLVAADGIFDRNFDKQPKEVGDHAVHLHNVDAVDINSNMKRWENCIAKYGISRFFVRAVLHISSEW
jgi:hypothetical protein